MNKLPRNCALIHLCLLIINKSNRKIALRTYHAVSQTMCSINHAPTSHNCDTATHSNHQNIGSKTLILVSFKSEIVWKPFFLLWILKSWCPRWRVRDATLEPSHNFFSRLLFGSYEWRWLPKEMSSQTDDVNTPNSFRDFNNTPTEMLKCLWAEPASHTVWDNISTIYQQGRGANQSSRVGTEWGE